MADTAAAATVPTTEPSIFKQSKEERQMEQKMVKVISKMHQNVQSRFQSLYVFSDERSKINDLFEIEVRQLSEKFMARKLPIVEKRDQILYGQTTDFNEARVEFDNTFAKLQTAVAGIVKSQEDKEADDEEAKAHVPTNVDHLKNKIGVPDFWSVAIKNHAMLQTIITEKDNKILEHLTSLHATQAKLPEPKLTITMKFSENDYFTNETLSFTAIADNDTNQLVDLQGCIINWKEGMDVTKKKVKKTQKNKKTGEKRVIAKTIPQDSFFNMFESKKEPENIRDRDDEDVDSEDDKIMQQLEEAHDVANDLFDLYTVDALEFYLNFGPELDGLMGDQDPDDDGDEDDDEDEKPKGGKKGGAPGKVGPDGKPEDCKQQ